jgi:uncharacterized metal-binding protein YceD (DUF177 family)
MKILYRDIKETGVHLEGVLPAADYDLPLNEYPNWKEIQYSFDVTLIEKECLVQGTLYTKPTTACARCLEALPIEIKIEKFEHSYPFNGQESIDLTQEIREDILLALPLSPRCQLDEDLRCPLYGKRYPEGSNQLIEQDHKAVWGALDQLKFKE